MASPLAPKPTFIIAISKPPHPSKGYTIGITRLKKGEKTLSENEWDSLPASLVNLYKVTAENKDDALAILIQQPQNTEKLV